MKAQENQATSFLRSAEAEDIANRLLDPALRGAVVLGQDGMGKTAVAAEVLTRLEGIVEPYRVHGSPVLSRIPYAVLTPFMDSSDARDLESPLVVLRNIRRYFRARAEAGHPQALLVVDDAHHLDEASSHVLVQLALSGELRLFVLSRSRGVQIQELLSLARDGLMARVDLAPLTPDAVHKLCTHLLDGPVLSASSSILAQMSGGNPLYVKALISAASRNGELVQRNQAWFLRALPTALEPTVQDLAKELLSGRTPAERSILEAVALAGLLPRSALASLGTQEAVQSLLDDGYLEAAPDVPDLIGYAQPLHADAVRSLVPPMRSITIRSQVRGHAPGTGKSASLAHLSWALDCGEQISGQDLLEGARRANAAGDSELAHRLAAAIQDESLRMAAQVQSAVAHLALGNISQAKRELDDAVAAAPDTDTLDAAVLASAQLVAASARPGNEMQTLTGAWASRDAELAAGRGDGTGADGTGRAAWLETGTAVLAVWARILDGNLLQAGPPAAGALGSLDPEAGQPAYSATPVFHEARALGFALAAELRTAAGTIGEAVRAAHGARTEILQDPQASSMARGQVFVRRAMALLHGGRFEKLRQLLMAERSANPHYLLAYGGTIGLLEGALEIRQGRFREGLLRLRPAVEALRSRDPERLLPYALGMAGYAASVTDDASPAIKYAAEVDALGYTGPKGCWLSAQAFAAAALAPQGTEEPPPPQIRELAAEARDAGQLAAEKDILELALAVGDLKQARRLVDLTDSFEGAEALALHAYAAAVAADNPERMVAAADEAVRCRKYLVAVECIGHAIRYYGAHNNLRRQRALIQQLRRRREELAGVTVSYLSPSVHQVRLTRREHEIVHLLLEGASTRDIATRFTLSQRTVEGHVYRIYVKLGISRRTELETVYRALEAEPEVHTGR
ncbi:hypothetical protein H9639_12370 [Arthrobacter sp. Sa2CUA1]|uniref:HTH luxR-type domain-containing protein n=1 Tax=Arthrobacter gallicola TaxID=2762225 RepID=A0ABR8UU50_9MICC|nr:LuxR C-terminal-related transcriptional regulator [Arthrobacter gallicola]MBD7996094.1 hypothetical protein [Arthrobacter gallicola]